MNVATHRAWHESFLPSKMTDLGEPRLLRSYTFLINGFAARLTKAELQQVASKPGFIRGFPNTICYLQTTQTPMFTWAAGERRGHQEGQHYGARVIIGFLDGGIDPRHPSLSDIVYDGGDVPKCWRGSCPLPPPTTSPATGSSLVSKTWSTAMRGHLL